MVVYFDATGTLTNLGEKKNKERYIYIYIILFACFFCCTLFETMFFWESENTHQGKTIRGVTEMSTSFCCTCCTVTSEKHVEARHSERRRFTGHQPYDVYGVL